MAHPSTSFISHLSFLHWPGPPPFIFFVPLPVRDMAWAPAMLFFLLGLRVGSTRAGQSCGFLFCSVLFFLHCLPFRWRAYTVDYLICRFCFCCWAETGKPAPATWDQSLKLVSTVLSFVKTWAETNEPTQRSLNSLDVCPDDTQRSCDKTSISPILHHITFFFPQPQKSTSFLRVVVLVFKQVSPSKASNKQDRWTGMGCACTMQTSSIRADKGESVTDLRACLVLGESLIVSHRIFDYQLWVLSIVMKLN
jgi:hypothetical protein